MSVRRDKRTGRWFFRLWVKFADGRRDRLYGTPGVAGPYHDLPNTKLGAIEAERRAISKAMTGVDVRPASHVPTIREYSTVFLDVFSAAHKASTKKDKRQRLDAYILPKLGEVRLDQLRQEHVDELIAGLLDHIAKTKGSRKTINNTTSVLSSLVKYAVKNKLIADPELTYNISAQAGAMDAVAPDNVSLIAAAAKDPRYRFALLAAADAGLRIGEIRALPRLEVNEIAREIVIAWSYDRNNVLGETKGWERRTVPMSQRLWDAYRAVPVVGPLVFSRLDGAPIGYDAVRDVVHEIYKRADVKPPKKPWHSLRHTFGTELANSGASIQTIRELMGHKSIETTMRYLHTTRDQKRKAIAGLASTAVPAGQPVGSRAKNDG